MSPLQIILDDRAKQKEQCEKVEERTEPHRNPFGDDDSSDSESEKPKVRQISSLSAARPQSPPREPSPPPLPKPAKTGPKGSQIARLVARRKDAATGLTKESREDRDEALFKYDVDRCEEEASAVGYARRPVEGFGELMLRSMGWQGTAEKGDTNEPTPRPARLGLGAKVEDLPPGLPGRRPRGRVNGVQDAKKIDVTLSQREVGGTDEEKRDAKGRDEGRRDGVTAESSEKSKEELLGRDGFAGDSKQIDGNATGKRRRKRSRFSHDPGR